MTENTPTEADAVSQESKPNWRRDLESRATAGDEAVAELAQLRRELSFRDAGVDPASKQGQYFMRGYDGEMTVDAIRAEAAELGLSGESNTPYIQPDPVDYGASSELQWRLTMLDPLLILVLTRLFARPTILTNCEC